MSKKILIIEDDPFLGDVLMQKLVHEGYEVTLTQDGKEGYAHMTTLQPDLVLLDIILPSMNGYEILEKKHVDPAVAKIPVIMISNSGQPAEINRALTLGLTDYLVKAQFDPEEVLAKVRTSLGEPSKAARKGEPGRLANVTVLWVEDDVFLSDILGKKLTNEGCIPLSARDGEEALSILATKVPDVMLLDLVLPGISGFDVLEKIKKEDRLKNIPVIVFSNLGQPGDIERAKKLGAVKHLIKAEIDVGEVVNEIAKIVKK